VFGGSTRALIDQVQRLQEAERYNVAPHTQGITTSGFASRIFPHRPAFSGVSLLREKAVKKTHWRARKSLSVWLNEFLAFSQHYQPTLLTRFLLFDPMLIQCSNSYQAWGLSQLNG